MAPESVVDKAGGQGMILWWVLLGVVVIVCFGLATENPGLGIGLAILATPVMLRLLVTIRRHRGTGRPKTGGEKRRRSRNAIRSRLAAVFKTLPCLLTTKPWRWC
jgi:hypothetical protein